ncbi:MAG TPA: GTPase HflX [Cytophagaceae bacterium]|nr:GTPase HflX [Cytophagaceae bacterium]
MKPTPKEIAPQKLRAVLVALISQKQSAEKTAEYLDELAFLTETSGMETVKKFTQRLERPDTRTFIGKGKLEEVKAFIKAEDIQVVVFDDDLTPSQIKNIENEVKVKVFDRSLLILEIFLLRAKTAQARTQVELARYEYLLPRLTNMWTHLERQRGGTGTRGGSGEKEIETDKRVIRDKISLLKEKLKVIDKQSANRRKTRARVTRAALVGYTNVGKSTLMNQLSKSEVFAENKLFATVDATVRKVVLERIPFLLSDTVGFIRKLPHSLIESFKSTLDEVREADILLHVVDISHPSFEEQIEVVNGTLAEIGAADKEVIMVFNKIDLYKPTEEMMDQAMDMDQEAFKQEMMNKLKATYMNKQGYSTVFISATKKENIGELRKLLVEKVTDKHLQIYPNYLKDSSGDYSRLFEEL